MGARRASGLSPEAVRTDDLHEAAGFQPEKDFRRRPRGFALPPAGEEVDTAWREPIRTWHLRGGPSEAGSEPLWSAAWAGWAMDGGRAHWPAVVLADGTMRSLGAVLRDAVKEAKADERVLTDNLAPLVWASAEVLAQGDLGTPLGQVIDRARESLARRLELSAEAQVALTVALEGLGEVLPADAPLADLRRGTAQWLLRRALLGAWEARRAAFDIEARRLREALADRLLLARLETPDGEQAAAALGAGAQHIDAAAFAQVAARARGSESLSPERRARLEGAMQVLDAWLAGDVPEPVFLAAADVDAVDAQPHPDPIAAASAAFDEVAAGIAEVVRAARTAALEIAGSYDPAWHDAALADLDWQAFTASELSLVPPVVAVTTETRLLDRDPAALSAVVRSGRPVVVLAEWHADDGAMAPGDVYVDLGSLLLAHREVFAIQASLARPEWVVGALLRLARAPRPGVVLALVPATGPDGSGEADALLAARAIPDFVWDPDAGESFADRFDLGGNPAPEAAWPEVTLPVHDREGGESTLELELTWADAMAQRPAWREHLRPIPAAGWDEGQVPLADWLRRFDPERSDGAVPYVWVVDEKGALHRAVVTRTLALACRERLRAWRFLQELGGYDNAYVRAAVERVRAEAAAEAAAKLAEVEAAHAVQLERVRAEAARESLERLATRLMDLDTALPSDLAVPAPTRPVAAPASPKAEAPAQTAEAPPEPQEEEDDLVVGEAYIDTILCTSCNECTQLNPLLFKYNADKQAELADLSAGTFADLVKAAEACPARCIHPGAPRAGDETATPELVKRAAEF